MEFQYVIIAGRLRSRLYAPPLHILQPLIVVSAVTVRTALSITFLVWVARNTLHIPPSGLKSYNSVNTDSAPLK